VTADIGWNRALCIKLLKNIIECIWGNKCRKFNQRIQSQSSKIPVGRSPKARIKPDVNPLAGMPHAVLSDPKSEADSSKGESLEDIAFIPTKGAVARRKVKSQVKASKEKFIPTAKVTKAHMHLL